MHQTHSTDDAAASPSSLAALVAGAELLHAKGARSVYAVASHALFSGPACARLAGGLFKEVIVTDSIPIPEHKRFPQLTVLSVAELLGETVKRMAVGSSVELVVNGEATRRQRAARAKNGG